MLPCLVRRALRPRAGFHRATPAQGEVVRAQLGAEPAHLWVVALVEHPRVHVADHCRARRAAIRPRGQDQAPRATRWSVAAQTLKASGYRAAP